MSGTAIIRSLLAARPSVTALVPVAKISAGTIPQGALTTAISVRPVSSNEQWTTARNLGLKMIRERIQVTAYAKDFPTLEKILKACSLGSGVHTGTILGYRVRSIMPDSVGPYIEATDDGIHEQSRDFMVTFMEAN